MNRKHVLVPVDEAGKGLKALYHALALAERIQAKVVVALSRQGDNPGPGGSWGQEVLMEVIQGACEEGLPVSCHIAEGGFEDEIASLVDSEQIDLIVVSADDAPMNALLQRVLPRLSVQVIQVLDKGETQHL